MKSFPILAVASLWMCSCGQAKVNTSQPTIVQDGKDTCDDPDANINCCFLNMPQKLTSEMNIADANEPGLRLELTGTIFQSDGKTPYPGVIIYAYHTDNNGLYSKKENETGVQKWHGHLHGWCKTDEKGNYAIHTIRPARYPDNTIPAHIHAAVKEPSGKVSYINDFVFKDDSLVNEKYISSLTLMGGNGIIDLVKKGTFIYAGKRDITLPD